MFVQESPQHFGPNSETFLRRLLWSTAVIMALLIVQSLWVYPAEWPRTMNKFGVGVVALFGLVMLRRWGLVPALHCVLWGMWLVVSAGNFQRYGLRNAAMLSYPLFVILSAWLLNLRHALWMVLATSIIALTLAYLEVSGIALDDGRSNPWVVATVLLFVMLIGAFISANIYFHVRDAHQHAVEVAHSLEIRVAERTEHLAQVNRELEAAMLDLRRAQKELVQADKLASLGSMVAGVAHELNTPIGNAVTAASTLSHAVQDFSDRAQEKSMNRSTLTQFVQLSTDLSDLLLRSTQRAADLVASFKRVAVDRTSEQRREFDLHTVVHQLLQTLSPTLKRLPWSIEVDVAESIQMDSYPGPLEQVLTNLVMNAVTHAFDGRQQGQVVVRATATTLADGSSGMKLEVSDNGCGMAADVLGRIFEPFFTTRLGRGGSGLGLSIAHSIATQVLGGQLTVHSAPDIGTTFLLEAPLVAPAVHD